MRTTRQPEWFSSKRDLLDRCLADRLAARMFVCTRFELVALYGECLPHFN